MIFSAPSSDTYSFSVKSLNVGTSHVSVLLVLSYCVLLTIQGTDLNITSMLSHAAAAPQPLSPPELQTATPSQQPHLCVYDWSFKFKWPNCITDLLPPPLLNLSESRSRVFHLAKEIVCLIYLVAYIRKLGVILDSILFLTTSPHYQDMVASSGRTS